MQIHRRGTLWIPFQYFGVLLLMLIDTVLVPVTLQVGCLGQPEMFVSVALNMVSCTETRLLMI